MPEWGMPKTKSDEGRRAGRPAVEAADLENSKGLKTMTTGILNLGTRYQLWVNQLVARRLEAEAAKFAR